MGAEKTIFLSDIHIGVNDPVNWYQPSVHKKYLKRILAHVEENAGDVKDLVILGDWFDFWTYPPLKQPPGLNAIFEAHPDLFTKQPSGNAGDFVTCMETIQGNLCYVNGNHDMLVTSDGIDAWFQQHTEKKVLYPRVEYDNKNISGYVNENGDLFSVHGHQFDLFNKPDHKQNELYKGLPIGHFITRVVGLLCEEELAKKHTSNAAGLKDSGNPTFSFKLVELAFDNFLEAVSLKKQLAKVILETLIDDSNEKDTDIRYKMYDASEIATSEVMEKFKNLWGSYDEIVKGGLEAGLIWKAEDLIKEHRIVLMGHTHDPTLRLMKRSNGVKCIYANSGYACPSRPDMKKKRKNPTFVVVEEDDRKYTVTLNKVDYSTLEIKKKNCYSIKKKLS